MSNLQLTQDERVALFQEWVLPLFIFLARAYFPTQQVVGKLLVIYKVALRLNSWGSSPAPATHLPPLAACLPFHSIQNRAVGSHCTVPAAFQGVGGPQWHIAGWQIPDPAMAPSKTHPLENVPLFGNVVQGLFLASEARSRDGHELTQH